MNIQNLNALRTVLYRADNLIIGYFKHQELLSRIGVFQHYINADLNWALTVEYLDTTVLHTKLGTWNVKLVCIPYIMLILVELFWFIYSIDGDTCDMEHVKFILHLIYHVKIIYKLYITKTQLTIRH
jgi:hypothetical protein